MHAFGLWQSRPAVQGKNLLLALLTNTAFSPKPLYMAGLQSFEKTVQ